MQLFSNQRKGRVIPVAYKAAKGEKVEHVNWVPFELVTPDKKEEYQAKYKK